MLLMIDGCRGKYFDRDNLFAPRPFRMGKPKAGAHPNYMKGWEDGCETGLSTMVHGYYKTFYGYKQDPKMLSNQRYYKAWKDAYTYCRHYSFRWSWEGFDPLSQKYSKPLCVFCDNETNR
jgi:hypothetical protein